MFFLVPAHLCCPRQNPESRKTVLVVVVVAIGTGLSPRLSVGMSVCQSVRWVNCEKMVDWMWMPLGVVSGVG